MSLLLQATPDTWIKGVDDWLGAIDHVIVIFGVPAAIVGYFRSRTKDREEAARNRLARERETEARELAVYEALDNKYLEFEELCLHYPSLNVFDVPDATTSATTPLQQKRELIALTMLFSLFERAFVMYRGQTSHARTAQWSGWDDFIAGYCKRINFQEAWKRSGSTFDRDFQTYMQQKIDGAGRNPAP